MNWALDKNEKLAYLNLWGKIEFGDDVKFRSVTTPLLKSGYLIYKINLFTPGGSVHGAKGIADQIRILQTRTVAPNRYSVIVNNRLSRRIIRHAGSTNSLATAWDLILWSERRGAIVRARAFLFGQVALSAKEIM